MTNYGEVDSNNLNSSTYSAMNGNAIDERGDASDEVPWNESMNGRFYREPSVTFPASEIPTSVGLNRRGFTWLPLYEENWLDRDNVSRRRFSAYVQSSGIIVLELRDNIRVEMTVDRALRVFNTNKQICLAIGKAGDGAALIHPNGRVYQYGSRVEIRANDLFQGNDKYAKMWHKGVSFTSDECALVYLVDSAGTRTTTDSFTDMSKDFSISVFYCNSRYGPECIPEAINVVEHSNYWKNEDGSENIVINGIRINQAVDGLLRIARCSNKYHIRTSPLNGTASLSTPFVHTTASQGSTSHLFVRRGERRMHYDGSTFIVRNAGHSAGFDEKSQLKVY